MRMHLTIGITQPAAILKTKFQISNFKFQNVKIRVGPSNQAIRDTIVPQTTITHLTCQILDRETRYYYHPTVWNQCYDSEQARIGRTSS